MNLMAISLAEIGLDAKFGFYLGRQAIRAWRTPPENGSSCVQIQFIVHPGGQRSRRLCSMSMWAIVLGVGRDQKLHVGADTAFLPLGSRPALAHVLCAAEACPEVTGIVVVVPPDRIETPAALRTRYGISKFRVAVPGTEKRLTNLVRALEQVDPDIGWVAVLETARPVVEGKGLTECWKAAQKGGAAAGGRVIEDPVYWVTGKNVRAPDGKTVVWAVQTPRVYRRDLLESALSAAARRHAEENDELRWVEAAGGVLRLVPISKPAFRLASADDLGMAVVLLP